MLISNLFVHQYYMNGLETIIIMFIRNMSNEYKEMLCLYIFPFFYIITIVCEISEMCFLSYT